MGFALKDRTTNVVNMMKFLMKAKTPYEVLEESKGNYTMHKRFSEIKTKYKKLIDKAILIGKGEKKLLFFQYGGDLSISGDLANELIYTFPDLIIVVAYMKGLRANLSLRGKNCRKHFLKAIEGLEDASGGGHDMAVGGRMNIEDLEKFRENLEKLI